MYRSQLGGGPAAPGATTPTSMPSSPRKDKEDRESRKLVKLIARSPLHDTAVETDMMKHTVPSTTRGSTHSSSLTSSHPTSAASSDRSSSQPAVTGSFPHFATGSAHPSLISSSHFPTGSIQEFVHVPQGLPSESQGRSHLPFQSSSQQQSLQRSFSDQPGMSLTERSRIELRASSSSSSSAAAAAAGVHSTGYVENPGDVEAAGTGGQRRYSCGQLGAIPANLKERRVLSGKIGCGDQGRSSVSDERVGPSATYDDGGGSGRRVIPGSTGEIRRERDSWGSTNLKRTMSSGSSSLPRSERGYSHADYSSLQDLSSTSLHAVDHNTHPPPAQLYSVAHQSHASSHFHATPPLLTQCQQQQQQLPSSLPPPNQHVSITVPSQTLPPHHHSSNLSCQLNRVPDRNFQSFNRFPPPQQGKYGMDHQVHRQTIMLPPSMAAQSGRHPHPNSSRANTTNLTDVSGYLRAYGPELPNVQYQAAPMYSSNQSPLQRTQAAGTVSSASYRSQEWGSHASSHRSVGAQFQPSLSTLDSHDLSLEESEPQGQSCFPEGETMHLCEQPMSLQEERLSPPPPSGRGSSSAPSSLQSPNHQQQNQQEQQQQQQHKKRPEHLDLDDYLAGETQRQLTLQGSDGESKSNSNINVEPLSIEIIEHPRDTTVKACQKAVFTCKALVMTHEEGRKVVEVDLEPQLQWYREGSPLSNEVMKDLILCDVKDEDSGSYHCIVTHPQHPTRTVCSSIAKLTVKSTPSDPSTSLIKEVTIISQPPSKVNVEVGQELQLVVEVKGEEPISFKWYKDLQVLDYCQKNVLRVISASPSDSGRYSCSVTNIHNSLLTSPSLVRVVQPKGKPSIVVHPLSQRVRPGQEVCLSVEVGVTPYACSFQWYKNYTKLDGLNKHVLIIHSAKPSDVAEYYCSVTNTAGMVDSNIAFVSIDDSRAPHPHASHPDHRFVDQPERLDSFLQQYGTHSYPQNQPFVEQGGRIGHGDYYVNPIGKSGLLSGSGGMEHRGYQPFTNWEFQRNVYESTADEDQPGGQGETGNFSGHVGSNQSAHASSSNSSSSSSNPSSQPLPASHISRPPHSSTGMSDPPGRTIIHPNVDSWSERRKEGSRGTREFPFRVGGGSAENMEDIASRGGAPPRIVEQPQSQKVDIGEPLSLSCRAVGQGDLSYLWFFNGLSIAMETRPEYYINCFTDEDEGVYLCRISNPWGSTDSKMAEVCMKEDD